MTRPTTTAFLAAAVLASGGMAQAASVDVTRVERSGGIEASEFFNFVTDSGSGDSSRIVESDGGSSTELGTETFDLAVGPDTDSSSSLRLTNISQRTTTTVGAEAGDFVVRYANAIAVDVADDEPLSGGSANTFNGYLAESSLDVEFDVLEESGYDLTFDASAEGFGRLNSEITLRGASGTGDPLFQYGSFFELSEAPADLDGALAPGSYVLSFGADTNGDTSRSASASSGFEFRVSSAATPIPSPAALPAGVALLGGLLARRRR